LLLCFYLLPAIAAILKVRKRKLAQISSTTDMSTLVDTNFVTLVKVLLLDGVSIKLNSLTTAGDTAVASKLNDSLSIISFKTENLRNFNLSIFTQAQTLFVLYK
jgi:hypothetical protein